MTSKPTAPPPLPADAPPAFKLLACSVCRFEVAYEAFARLHPCEPQVEYAEETYLRADPWAQRRRPLAVGYRCSQCSRDVCAAPACSVFYSKTFCAPCARASRAALPAALLRELDAAA